MKCISKKNFAKSQCLLGKEIKILKVLGLNATRHSVSMSAYLPSNENAFPTSYRNSNMRTL